MRAVSRPCAGSLTALILFHGDVEASLVNLILDVAAILHPHIAQHLRQHPFQRVVLHLSARFSQCLHLLVPIITNIKSGSIEVAGVLRGISVAGAELRHIVLGTQDAGYDNLMQGDSLDLQRVEIGSSDVLQEHRGTRHQVRDAIIELIHIEEWVAAHIH